MKKSVLYISFIILLIAVACSFKKTEDHDHDHADVQAEWKEMDDFHTIMAEAFHPYKDSSNLAPAKAHAADLASAAERWASAPLPEKVNNDEVKGKLEQLKASATSFASVVQAGDDEVIGESLTALHDLFHEIQEAWYGDKGHEHH